MQAELIVFEQDGQRPERCMVIRIKVDGTPIGRFCTCEIKSLHVTLAHQIVLKDPPLGLV